MYAKKSNSYAFLVQVSKHVRSLNGQFWSAHSQS
jgi:hypothetical protein